MHFQPLGTFNISAKIRKMSRRKQKSALRRQINIELLKFINQPNSPIMGAEVRKIMMTRYGDAFVDIDVYPYIPVEYIDMKIVV